VLSPLNLRLIMMRWSMLMESLLKHLQVSELSVSRTNEKILSYFKVYIIKHQKKKLGTILRVEQKENPLSKTQESIQTFGDKSYYYWHKSIPKTVPIEPPQLIEKKTIIMDLIENIKKNIYLFLVR